LGKDSKVNESHGVTKNKSHSRAGDARISLKPLGKKERRWERGEKSNRVSRRIYQTGEISGGRGQEGRMRGHPSPHRRGAAADLRGRAEGKKMREKKRKNLHSWELPRWNQLEEGSSKIKQKNERRRRGTPLWHRGREKTTS